MSASPSISNSNKTFTVTPSSNLSYPTTYKIRVTTGVKDSSGNALSSQYETTNGFTISGSFFLTVGDSGTILTSPDGTTWTSRNYAENIGFSGVTYANSTFFVVGNDDILSSTDVISWTSSNTGIYSNENLVDLAYGNNLFVVVVTHQSHIYSSSNGTSWTLRSFCASSCVDVTYGNGIFVVGSDSYLKTSSDGSNWNSYHFSSDTNAYLYGLTFGNNTFVGVGYSGLVLTSSDNGTSWDNRTSGTTKRFMGVTFGNDTFVAVGLDGTILTSSDNGTSWDDRTSIGVTINDLQEVTFGNNTFVAVGSSGTILTSSDNGTTWTSRTSGTNRGLRGVTYKE